MSESEYRIDREYNKVFIYDQSLAGYVFLCSFWEIGATSLNRDKTIVKKIETFINRPFFNREARANYF